MLNTGNPVSEEKTGRNARIGGREPGSLKNIKYITSAFALFFFFSSIHKLHL